MKLFDVYPLYEVTPTKAQGVKVWDEKGEEYLDFYGGHGVISIGHCHPHYTAKIKAQLDRIGFYSNAVQNPLQKELARLLGQISGLDNYDLFLCSTGAEANENALKVASFYTGKSRIIAFEKAFHGRTSAAVSVTDNKHINAPINQYNPVTFLPLNDFEKLDAELAKGDVAGVMIEAIQGVGGLDQPTTAFFQHLEKSCRKNEAVIIADEVQAGYGRTGDFFAFQKHQITPDIVSIAKGMGNGFPVAGVLINEKIPAKYGMLGTTFGGNHLACAAAIAVLEVIQKEELMHNAQKIETYFRHKIKQIATVKKIKGRGLMLGVQFDFEVGALRKKLIYKHGIFTGGATDKKLLRILPPLNITTTEIDIFITALQNALQQI